MNLRTKRKSNFLLPAVILLVGILLTGCSVINEFYLNNATGEAVKVRLTFDRDVAQVVDFDPLLLASGPLIETISSNARQTLPETLSYQTENEQTIQFTLPPQTTVYLGSTRNSPDLFTRLEIKSDQVDLTVDQQNQQQYFETRDRLIGNIVHVLSL